MKIINTIAMFLYSFGAFAQTHTLTLTVGDFPEQTVLIASYYGEKNFIIDSAKTDKNGRVVFTLDKKKLPGQYKVVLKGKGSVDLIYNNEDVEIKTHSGYPADSLKVIRSDENELYYSFRRFDSDCRMKLELLSPLVTYYPDKNKFYKEAVKEYGQLQKMRNGFIEDISENKPDAFAAKIIRMEKTPFLDPSLTDRQKQEFMKAHFFDNLDFNDTALFRTNVYTNKAITYLTFFGDRSLSQTELEKEFIKAVDVILSKVNNHDAVYEFVLEYLVGGFEKYHFDNVLDHIATHYRSENFCKNDERKSVLQKRLDSYKKLAVGKPAPDFSLTDIDGNEITIASFSYDKLVILFWATWCPHCKEILPKIKALYDAQETKTWEVIAVSLDTSGTAWRTFLKEGDYNWINTSELKGWESTIADIYNIYATPTMFVIDRERKILAKPITFGSLELSLGNE
ncbi:MAG: redoxin domain-containing protein [Bacteroidetes bacterium]|nr:redoxin domain-containing protein [Bacteroidota bacterium]